MCGIFGYFDNQGESLSQSVLEAMGHSIRHRGPDEAGLFQGEGVALGNQRLSIMDLDHGRQPFRSDDGRVVVVQNGEIFNHVELAAELAAAGYPCRTHCDTEVILRLYEVHGISALRKLNGMFAIAIFDRAEDALYLVRDRIGIKPLYVYTDAGRTLFASEIKALLKAGVRPVPEPEAIDQFLAFNYVPRPLTLFKGVHHVMPGHFMRLDRKGIKSVCWWDLNEVQPDTVQTEDAWIEEFNHLLDDAVRLRLRCDVPFGAFLSGGVDSSSVVGHMSRHMDEPVRTFSIGFDDPRYDESPFAEQAAQRFHTRHTLEKVQPNMLGLWPMTTWHCDQPHGDVSFMPTYRVAELASRQVKVVLTGDGGDELFAGYDKYRDFFSGDGWQDTPISTFRQDYRRQLTLFSADARKRLYSDSMQKQVQADPFNLLDPLWRGASHQDRINQALLVDMQLLLSGNNLVKPDRMGMAVSLEARTPFLDYRMMEMAFRMPGHFKLKNGETKYLFKKAVTPLIGEDLAYRKKQMFTVPVGDWFRNELAGFCERALLNEMAIDRGLFQPEEVAGMLRAHQNGEANYTRELRALIALEIWFRLFADNLGDESLSLESLGLPLQDPKRGAGKEIEKWLA